MVRAAAEGAARAGATAGGAATAGAAEAGAAAGAAGGAPAAGATWACAGATVQSTALSRVTGVVLGSSKCWCTLSAGSSCLATAALATLMSALTLRPACAFVSPAAVSIMTKDDKGMGLTHRLHHVDARLHACVHAAEVWMHAAMQLARECCAIQRSPHVKPFSQLLFRDMVHCVCVPLLLTADFRLLCLHAVNSAMLCTLQAQPGH